MGHDKALDTDQAVAHEKLQGKRYAKELKKLHADLVSMQEWIKHKGLKVCIIFEGRDGAGKGGTIKAITERLSPRVFRVVALPAPTEREKSQMYLQRYVPHEVLLHQRPDPPGVRSPPLVLQGRRRFALLCVSTSREAPHDSVGSIGKDDSPPEKTFEFCRRFPSVLTRSRRPKLDSAKTSEFSALGACAEKRMSFRCP
jgi:hypothetical protein